MTEATTRSDYADRIDRVIQYLVDHLDDSLELHRLAEVACFSPFHFHRIYVGVQGETVADTVRRLRLHRAAVDLIAGRPSIERIAHRAGYGSQAAFTRAFKAAYGVPPATYRASFVPSPLSHARTTMHSTDTYQVTIRNATAQVVAALPHKGDYQKIGHTFERLTALAAGQGLMGPTSRSFGIYYDDPNVIPLDQLRSEACVTVADTWQACGELQRRELRAGRYAVILHVGPYAELHRAYDWLFGAWLSTSGEEAADAPCLEEYLNDPRTLPPTEWKTEIWLPLK